MTEREWLVCAACGKHFQIDDFSKELGDLVTCPFCAGVEMDIELPREEPETPEATADAA